MTTSAPHEVTDFHASISAQSDGQSVKVYAALLVGTDFVVLDPGDYFTARVGTGDPLVMVREPDAQGTDGSKVHYLGTFVAPKDATDVIVAFNRPKGRIGAPLSVVRIAPAFAITSVPPVRLRPSDVLAVTVSPAPQLGDDMKLQLHGDCVPSGGPYPLAFNADGSASFLVSRAPVTGSGCDVRIEVRRETIGNVDSVFQRDAWGQIETMDGLQSRSFSTAIAR